MSAQSNWWESVARNLERLKGINPTVDTCPFCWATSGLPAVVFKGESDLSQDTKDKIKTLTKPLHFQVFVTST